MGKNKKRRKKRKNKVKKRAEAKKGAKKRPKKKTKEKKKKCPTIEIVDRKTGSVISGKTTNKVVGQKIQLKVQSKPAGKTITEVKWNIPGTIVKNYTSGDPTAKVAKIEQSDKEKINLDFYWVDGADNRSVTVTCKIDGVLKNAEAKFNVKAPKLDKFDPVTDSVHLSPTGTNPNYFTFGEFDALSQVVKIGIKYNWKVTVPSLIDGYVKDVQIINTITKMTTTGGTKKVYTISGKKTPPNKWQLDTTNPYTTTSDSPTDGFPKKVTKGTSHTNTFSQDSPGTPLTTYKYAMTNDQFKYYIMYKPDESDAIWVPIAKVDWMWKGKAEYDSGTSKWVLKDKDGKVTSSGGKGQITTEFPKYDTNVKNNKLENE